MSKPVLLSLGAGKVQELAGANDNDVLTWDSTLDGGSWKSAAGGGGSAVTMGGDVSGSSSNATVTKIQNIPVSTTDPTVGKILQYTGTEWAPADAPQGGSGGGGVTYYFNKGTARSGGGLPAATYQLGRSAEAAQTNVALTNLATGSWTRVGGFVTDASDPSVTTVPAGLWDFNLWAYTTAAANNQAYLRLTLYAYNGSTNPESGTALAQTDNVYLYDANVTAQYIASMLIAGGTTLPSTSTRLYLLIEARASTTNRDVTVYFGNGTPSHTHSTIPTVGGTGIVHVVDGVFQTPASAVDLESNGASGDVTGILPVANGGTGAAIASINTVFAGPSSGSTGAPLFRALVVADIPSLSATYLPLSGGTLTGKLITPALTISAAGFNIAPTSATPTTLANGDMWTTTSGLFARINGATQQYGALGISNSWTSTNTFSAATVSFGTSANTGTVSLGTGATLSGSTKTVNVGTGGLAGSTTTITIGATAGTSTTTLNGTVSLANALAVGSGGTNNASLAVTQGTVYYGDGSKLVGLAPGTSGQFLQTQGTSANPQWASVTAYAQPYDFASRFVGTPVASRILAEWVADRAVTLATSGWQFWCVTRPGTTTTNLLIKKNGSLIATYQFTTTATLTNNRYLGVLSGSITATTLTAGDFLTVESDTTVDAVFSTPIFAILGTA